MKEIDVTKHLEHLFGPFFKLFISKKKVESHLTNIHFMLLFFVWNSIKLDRRLRILQYSLELENCNLQMKNEHNNQHLTCQSENIKQHTNWLIEGCTQPVVIALIVAIASSPPAAPRQCPIIDWNNMGKNLKHDHTAKYTDKFEINEEMHYNLDRITLVAFILIPAVFLKTFLTAFTSARSPTMVEVA